MSPPPPGQLFNLSGFTLQLPLDDGSGTVKEVDGAALAAGFTDAYFYTSATAAAGAVPAAAPGAAARTDAMAMTFWAPTNGFRTAHSNYPRSELKEDFEWDIGNKGRGLRGVRPHGDGGTHTMNVTTTVLQAPPNGKIVIGQVHGIGVSGHCSVVLEVEWDNGLVMAAMRDSGCNYVGQHLGSGFAVGEPITYSVTVRGSQLTVATSKAAMAKPMDYGWYRWPVSFKCGSYSQDAGSSSAEGGRVGVTHIQTHHGTALSHGRTHA